MGSSASTAMGGPDNGTEAMLHGADLRK